MVPFLTISSLRVLLGTQIRHVRYLSASFKGKIPSPISVFKKPNGDFIKMQPI